MTSRAFDFVGSQGHRLSGKLELPDGEPQAWAVFAHCFTCGKDSLASSRIARALSERGVGVLRFDFAGLGSSEGAFAESTFAADVEDLLASAQALTADGKAPALLVGHSLGGAAVLMAAGQISGIRAVVTIGAPSDAAHVLHQFDAGSLQAIEETGEAEVLLAGRPFVVRKSFIEDVRRHDISAEIAQLRVPLLVMHSPVDATVGIENAARIFGAAKHPKSFVSLDGADHLLTRRGDADYVAAMIATWAGRYVSTSTSS